ncbi:MAG: hypothetical protein H6682_20280 [Candidatus Eisenbacteria bacterium]|nr:hypothetical protein [Candidatus Eisenbacteria bacterium]
MSNRRNRIWSGATRSVVLFFLIFGTLTIFSARADAYMPPPVQAPELIPDELPWEDQQIADGETDATDLVSSSGASRAQDWGEQLLHHLVAIFDLFMDKE